MNDIAYYFIPISIAIFVEYFIPYANTLQFKDNWFSPPFYINFTIFVAKYILLGSILYHNQRIQNDKITAFCWVSIALNLIWGYYINRNNKYALIFLFLSLLFATVLYNEVFLSDFTLENETLYIDLLSAYIVWLGFMITSVYEMGSKNRSKMKM